MNKVTRVVEIPYVVWDGRRATVKDIKKNMLPKVNECYDETVTWEASLCPDKTTLAITKTEKVDSLRYVSTDYYPIGHIIYMHYYRPTRYDDRVYYVGGRCPEDFEKRYGVKIEN